MAEPLLKPGLRIDKWLWFARFAKTRGMARRLLESGLVLLNEAVVTKHSALVREGDRVTLLLGRGWRRVRVAALGERREGAPEARLLYAEEAKGRLIGGEMEETGTASEGCPTGSECVRQRLMIDQIVSWFLGKEAVAGMGADDARIASAALLVEAASVDGDFNEGERRRILVLLGERFGLDQNGAEALLSRAVALQRKTNQLFPLTKTIVDRFGAEDRIRLIEMLWEVVYADGRLDDYEANLVRRVAGLLYVPDRDSGMARQRALARLGIPDQLGA